MKAKKYTIFEGLQYSNLIPSIHRKKEWLVFNFCFNTGCYYDLHNQDNYDINKLYGFGWGLRHHKNSFRIGWNCELQNGNIQLFAYWYENGQRHAEYLTDVKINDQYSAILNFNKIKNQIIVSIGDNGQVTEKIINFNFRKVPSWGFRLFPFFGGTSFCPQKMSITINEK